MVRTQFMPTFPCFSVLADDCREPYLVETQSGAKALLVLTDEDQLQRFRERGETAGPTIRFEMAGQLALYLDALPKDITHIAFDPSVIGKAVTVSASELYLKLLQSVKS